MTVSTVTLEMWTVYVVTMMMLRWTAMVCNAPYKCASKYVCICTVIVCMF